MVLLERYSRIFEQEVDGLGRAGYTYWQKILEALRMLAAAGIFDDLDRVLVRRRKTAVNE
jgi:hypothetical protein